MDSGYEGIVQPAEINEGNHKRALETILEWGLVDIIRSHNQPSIDFLEEFKCDGRTISLAFLDSGHSKAAVIQEFEFICPHLDHKSIVFFDNTSFLDVVDGRVNQVLKVIKEKFGKNLINFKSTSWYTPGQAIWQQDPFLHDWNAS